VPLESLGGFLFAFHSNYGDILCRLRERLIGRKSRNFYTPPVFSAPQGVTPSEFCKKCLIAGKTSCVDHKDRNVMWPTAAFAYSFTMPTVLQSIQKNFTQSMWLAKRV